MKKIYIASGWFTPEQAEKLEEILAACKEAEVEVYSPRDDFLYKPGMKSKPVFDANIAEIKASGFVLASTEGKDMGTLFECGFAYASGIPVVYYYTGVGKFNLMLAESAFAVITHPERLKVYLEEVADKGYAVKVPYIGAME